METVICTTCGYENFATAKVCAGCKTPLVEGAEVEIEVKEKDHDDFWLSRLLKVTAVLLPSALLINYFIAMSMVDYQPGMIAFYSFLQTSVYGLAAFSFFRTLAYFVERIFVLSGDELND